MSVQANKGAYCSPRVNDAAKYTRVEVGFPSQPESLLMEWAELSARSAKNFPILKCWIVFFYSEMITNSYNIVPKYTDRQLKSQVGRKITKCGNFSGRPENFSVPSENFPGSEGKE